MPRDDSLLPSFLELVRSQRNIQQSQLAKMASVSNSYVSQVFAGNAVPNDERLAAFAAALDVEDQLPQMLLRAAHDRIGDSADNAKIRIAYMGLIQELDADSAKSVARPPRRTLEYFPKAFEPLVIVTGDKREDPPKTPGDLGALSASPLDDRYLRRIPLPSTTEKISDKVFVVASEAELRRAFGECHLFVVGSPASNHLARKINQEALFRFAFHRETVEEIERIIQLGVESNEADGVSGLEILRERKKKDFKFIMNEFKQGGIFDPLPSARKLRARSLRYDVDFATITIALHPYAKSSDYVAIMAAGFHLPGTVHAVRLLSEPVKFFQDHPFGGVVEVKMTEASWHERIEKAHAAWDTDGYRTADLIAALESVRDAENPDWPVSGEEAERLIRLVRNQENPGV